MPANAPVLDPKYLIGKPADQLHRQIERNDNENVDPNIILLKSKQQLTKPFVVSSAYFPSDAT